MDTSNLINEIDERREVLSADDMIDYLENLLVEVGLQCGHDSSEFMTVLCEMGSYYRSVGQFRKSANAYGSALELIREAVGVHDRRYMSCLSSLAESYRLEGDYEACKKTLDELEYLHDDYTSPFYAACLNHQGQLALDMGDYDLAREYFISAIDIVEFSLPGTPWTSSLYANLASAYMASGNFSDAEVQLSKALQPYESGELPSDSRNAIAVLGSIAHLYERKGDRESARKICLREYELLKTSDIRATQKLIALTSLGIFFMRAGDDEILNEILQTTRKICSQPAIADNRFAKNALIACEMWERHLGYR